MTLIKLIGRERWLALTAPQSANVLSGAVRYYDSLDTHILLSLSNMNFVIGVLVLLKTLCVKS